MSQELILQTIDEVHQMDEWNRKTALKNRYDWLERQRAQDRKEVGDIAQAEYALRYKRKKKKEEIEENGRKKHVLDE